MVEGITAVEINLQGNVAKGLDGLTQRVVAVGPVLSGQDNSGEPEVREDEVEQQDVAVVCAEEECNKEEYDSQDRLREGGSVLLPTLDWGTVPLTMTSR